MITNSGANNSNLSDGSATSPALQTGRERSLFEAFKDNFYFYALLLIVAVIVGLILIWIFTTQRVLVEKASYQTVAQTYDDNALVQIRYPKKLLLGEPAELHVAVRASDAQAGEYSIQLQLPDEIMVTHPISESIGLLLSFNLDTKESQTQIIRLENQGMLTKGDISQIDVFVVQPQQPRDFPSFEIEIEGTEPAARRQLLTSTVDEKSPLILGIAAFVGAIPLLLQIYQKYREDRKEREAKSTQAHDLVEQVREFLRQANYQGANKAAQQIRGLGLNKNSPPEWQDVQDLLKISRGELLKHNGQLTDCLQQSSLEKFENLYLNEFVGALICGSAGFDEKLRAMDKAYQNKAKQNKDERDKAGQVREAIIKIFRGIPLERVGDNILRDKFIQARHHKIDRFILQQWQPEFDCPPDESGPHLEEIGPADLKHNPFHCERAEWEQTTLFNLNNLGVFWESHPLYQRLFSDVTFQNHIIHGEVGSGRTAMALGLYFKQASMPKQTVIFHMAGTLVSVGELQSLLANRLFSYIEAKPTLLSNLGEAERTLIAFLLSNTLTPEYCRASLVAATRRWLIAEQIEERRILGETQLAMLIQALPISSTPLTETDWVRKFVRILHSLEFKVVRLVIDAPPKSAQWTRTILSHAETWRDLGLATTIFVPDKVFEQISDRIKPSVRVSQLCWNEDNLRQLFENRFEVVTGIPFEEIKYRIFPQENDYHEYILNAHHNPRRLMRLWQEKWENAAK